LRPGALEEERVGEGLNSRRFPDREISHGAVRAPQHVLSTGYAMVASLERFRWLVQRAAGMADIATRARLKTMRLESAVVRVALRIGQVADCVAHGLPC